VPAIFDPASPSKARLLGYLGLWLLIAYWSLQLLHPPIGQAPWIFLDNLNLLIHEAGHWIFLPFGQFMYILGGSLNQCLIPAIFLGYFSYYHDWAGCSFTAFWLGDNLVNVSYYIGDAQTMALPLLGGDTSGHDWHNLLSMTNALPYDYTISMAVRVVGWGFLFAALISLALIMANLWLNANSTTGPQSTSGATQ
jgi:hypothetical protein